MKAHVSTLTLGVRDINRARQFYSEGLGWPIQQEYPGTWVNFSLGGGTSSLSLYPWDALAGERSVGEIERELRLRSDSGFPSASDTLRSVLS